MRLLKIEPGFATNHSSDTSVKILVRVGGTLKKLELKRLLVSLNEELSGFSEKYEDDAEVCFSAKLSKIKRERFQANMDDIFLTHRSFNYVEVSAYARSLTGNFEIALILAEHGFVTLKEKLGSNNAVPLLCFLLSP